MTLVSLLPSKSLSLVDTAVLRYVTKFKNQCIYLHIGLQIVPLFSQCSHPLPAGLTTEKLDALINRVQFGGDEVVQAKAGAGSATLSMAYAGAEFAEKVIRALKGEKGIVTPTFVHLSADAEGGKALQKEVGGTLEYFSSNVELGVREHNFANSLALLTVSNSLLVWRRSSP